MMTARREVGFHTFFKNRKTEGKYMITANDRVGRGGTAALAAALILASPFALAKPAENAGEQAAQHWTEWTALGGSGYVGRARVPAKMDRPVSDRKLARVQQRAQNLSRQRSKLAKRLRSGQRASVDTSSLAAELATLDQRLAGARQLAKKQANTAPAGAVWLRTADEGLYSVTVAELAAQFNVGKAKIRRQVRSDGAELTHNGEPVEYDYDRKTDRLLFVAEAYETFYADHNAYRLVLREGIKGTNGGRIKGTMMNNPVRAANGKARSASVSAAPANGKAQSASVSAAPANSKAQSASVSAAPANGKAQSASVSAAPANSEARFARADGVVSDADVPITPTAAIGSAQPFMESLKFEEEPDLYFSTWVVVNEPDADFWFWDYLSAASNSHKSIDLNLDIPDPALSGTAQLRVTLRGYTNVVAGNDHNVSAMINGVAVGAAAVWDGFAERILVADFDQGLLRADGANVLTLVNNLAGSGFYAGEYLDQVEIDYERQPVAVDGKLWLRDVAAGAQRVTGLSSPDILVVENPGDGASFLDSARIDDNGAGEYSVTFEATGGADYLVVENASIATPLVEVDQPSDLSSEDNSADYLIIAPQELAGTAEALAAYRSNEYGSVKIAWLNDIYDEFSAGREDPFAISRFMERVSSAWANSPAMVTLVGNGTLDNQDRMGYGDSFIPVLMTSTPWQIAPSDDRLLRGNGDLKFASGRLPITNDDEGLAYVEKLKAYEAKAEYSTQAVLVADNPDGGGNFHVNADMLGAELRDSLGFDSVLKVKHPQDPVRTTWTTSSTWDAGFVSYDGHGLTTNAGSISENFLTVEDAESLINDTLPVFAALSCSMGDFSLPGTRPIAAALALNASGGAIAALAPTGYSQDAQAQLLGRTFVNNLYGDSDPIGVAMLDAKIQTTDSIQGYMGDIYSVIGDPAVRGR